MDYYEKLQQEFRDLSQQLADGDESVKPELSKVMADMGGVIMIEAFKMHPEAKSELKCYFDSGYEVIVRPGPTLADKLKHNGLKPNKKAEQ